MKESMMLKPFYMDFNGEEKESLKEIYGSILDSGVLILGHYTEKFESEFSNYIGTKYAVSMNTCTSVLEVLCVAAGLANKKVAVTNNTNFASVEAILRAGGHPYLMDIDKKTLMPDPDQVIETIKKLRIEGVMWVHIGGNIVPGFERLAQFCKEAKVKLIEDCAHAHGSKISGKMAGTFGIGGGFSFFPTKVMTTMEGGMLVTDEEEVALLARSLRNQGKRFAAYGGLHYDHGNSWRMSEISAAMGSIQLAKLNQMINIRDRAAKIVEEYLRDAGISYCDVTNMEQASRYKVMVLLNDNCKPVEEIKKILAEQGITLGGGVYETPISMQPVFKGINRVGTLEVSEKFCPRHICPPITSGTRDEDAHYIGMKMAEVIIG
jgi:dTDP-4-amino-4,6-dideoxygalactose transaminase